MSAKWQQVKEILQSALDLPPSERADFLDSICDGDDSLRERVETLLASSDNIGSFMEQGAIGEVAEMFVGAEKNPLKIGATFNHYKIIKQIGAGGMGEVYLAEDKKLDRKVAIKCLNDERSRDADKLYRFIREAKAASALNHPNILVIHEIGESKDIHYIVGEYIEGETLREVCGKPLKTSKILDISIQITSALVAAHAAGIVHRDIKPENIMIRNDGFAKVLDFGLAKLVEQKPIGLEETTVKQNETAKGVIMGTVSYMSPEQARGEHVDERTDIFSFGVLLYEMITGRPPFASASTPETLANLINKDPQPLSRFATNVPDELQRIVSKTLRKDKEARYQTMKGLLADLRELKDTLAFDEKLERSRPASENDTAILQATTGNANKQTAKTQHSFSQKIKNHKPITAFALAAVLIGIFGFGYYWFFGNRASSSQIKSLAVLPLKSLDAGENYLGLGIADTVIRRINQTGQLIVRPTSAVRRYLNDDTDALAAAKQLNADAVLEGSVQRADDRLRVSVNLLRTSDSVSLWSDNFDMKMTDIFTIQDTVAQKVASRLQLRLDPAQQARMTKRATSDPVAWELYLKGVYAFDQRVSFVKPQMDATINFFKRAVESDPNFALAHAQLAYVYATNAEFFEPTEPIWAERANEEINRAEKLDSQLAETHLARFQLLYGASEGYQGEAAVREVLLAQQLNPNAGHGELAYLYLHLGLEDLGERELQRAFEIDPTSEFAKAIKLLLYEVGCKYDEYAAHRDLYHDVDMEAIYLMGTGRLDEAQKAIDEFSATRPDDIVLPHRKALLLALKGDFRAAEAAIPVVLSRHPVKDPLYHHATYEIARIYALEGKATEAVKWLRETASTGYQPYPLFECDPYLNRVRQASEFIQFMIEMKAQNEEYRREFASTP